MTRLVADRRQRLVTEAKLLNSLSYRGVLARGFAIVTGENGLVRSAAAVSPGEPLAVEFADGRLPAVAGGGA